MVTPNTDDVPYDITNNAGTSAAKSPKKKTPCKGSVPGSSAKALQRKHKSQNPIASERPPVHPTASEHTLSVSMDETSECGTAFVW